MLAETQSNEMDRDGLEPSPARRRPASLRRRVLVLAAAVLAPLVIGALASGLVLLHSATRSHRLADEAVRESGATVALFQSLEAARLAGSSYMEEGERQDLAAFRSVWR
jgi:hypothetical protein